MPLMRLVALPYFEKMIHASLTPDTPPEGAPPLPHRVPDSALSVYLQLTQISLTCHGGPNPYTFEAQIVHLKDLTPYVFATESGPVRGAFLTLLRAVFSVYRCEQGVPAFMDESGYLTSLMDHIQGGLATALSKGLGGAGGGAAHSALSGRDRDRAAAGAGSTKDLHKDGQKERSLLMFALQCVDCLCQEQPRMVEIFGAPLLRIAHHLLGEHVARAVSGGCDRTVSVTVAVTVYCTSLLHQLPPLLLLLSLIVTIPAHHYYPLSPAPLTCR